jgi:hypothetical protein
MIHFGESTIGRGIALDSPRLLDAYSRYFFLLANEVITSVDRARVGHRVVRSKNLTVRVVYSGVATSQRAALADGRVAASLSAAARRIAALLGNASGEPTVVETPHFSSAFSPDRAASARLDDLRTLLHRTLGTSLDDACRVSSLVSTVARRLSSAPTLRAAGKAAAASSSSPRRRRSPRPLAVAPSSGTAAVAVTITRSSLAAFCALAASLAPSIEATRRVAAVGAYAGVLAGFEYRLGKVISPHCDDDDARRREMTAAALIADAEEFVGTIRHRPTKQQRRDAAPLLAARLNVLSRACAVTSRRAVPLTRLLTPPPRSSDKVCRTTAERHTADCKERKGRRRRAKE